MSFGELLDTAFRILRDHFALIVGLAATVSVPLALLTARTHVTPHQIQWVPFALSMLVSLGASPIITVALTYAISEIFLGRLPTIGQSLNVALKLFVPLSGTMLLLYLGIAGGFLLLVIPGIYLMCVWMLTWEVMVIERGVGTGALKRSRALMRGNVWRALGILIVGWIIVMVVEGTLGLIARPIPMLGPLVNGFSQAIGTAYSATVSVLLYFDIRCRKEAFDLDHLARLVETAPVDGRPAAA